MNVSLFDRRGLDDSGRRRHRLSSESGSNRPAIYADRSFRTGYRAVPGLPARASSDLGGGLGVGSVLLMLLGTQWYILFNVIAGATAIPGGVQRGRRVLPIRRLDRWRKVILPGIFPYLVTGMVTASGGAWNASIVAEYFHFRDRVMSTTGLGAQISAATRCRPLQ